MAARPTWKGFLKISLVNIPMRVFPGHRLGGHHQLQPAACRVSDPHPAEALVPDLRARSADVGRSPRATSSRRAATSS